MKIEAHLLQNFAPSCLNRDDTNTPKSCVFGGFPRARVSSQCWKRAARDLFAGGNGNMKGMRTKRLQELLGQEVGGAVTADRIRTFVEECYSKVDGKRPEETAVLVFIGKQELEEAARCLREGVDGKTALARLRRARQSVDIALFGRMLAEKPEGNIDAACQVAHAISTNAVDMEDDFYTAVDDLVEERGEIGAGMMGTQGYNSACFYRYALVDRDQLETNMGGDPNAAAEAAEVFIKAFALAVPSAKQNSHAAQSLPSFGLLIARETGAPVSLANAFARPVRGDDLIGGSIRAIAGYWSRMEAVYGLYKGAGLAVFHDREKAEAGSLLGDLSAADKHSFAGAVAAVMERVRA